MRYLPLIIIGSLPLLAALGHDCYLYYENMEKGFSFSQVGFLFYHYIPEEFQQIRASVDADQWKMMTKYFFDRKTVSVAAVPLVLNIFIAIVLMIFKSRDE